MDRSPTLPPYSLGEEIAHAITHGVGIVLSIAGLAVLVGFASKWGETWHVIGCSIFGATLIFAYTASTLYHSIPLAGAKGILRNLDHSAIFLLIAGTYTPFTLVNLRGPWGWSILGVVWGLAIVGITIEFTPLRKVRAVPIALYLILGWLIVIAIKPMIANVAPGGLALVIAGGLVYTAGMIFYGLRRMPYHHAIWHVFVLVGSTLHFFAVLFYVIPVQ